MVILGAGFGGMYTYTSLSRKCKKQYDITIINRTNHFLFTPLLHEVATGSLETFHIVEPIRSLIDSDTRFLQTDVLSVDTDKKIIMTRHGSVAYDMLISSLGSQTSFFNVPGAAEHSLVLKTLADAVHIKNMFIQKFEAASREPNKDIQKQLLSFVIIGSGPTGVELVGEAANLFFETFGTYYKHLYHPDDISLVLMSSHDTVLRSYKKILQTYAEKTLLGQHVHIKKNVRVVEVTPHGVVCDTGEVVTGHTVIWTGGVVPQILPDVSHNLVIKNHKIVVDEYMRAKNVSDVYVIGDMSYVEHESGSGYPMSAQVAKQQGRLLGKNLSAVHHGLPLKKFIYKERGMLASLGNYAAVADIFGIPITGRLAWFIWRTIYIGQFISWRKRFRILFDWTIHICTPRDITQI